MTIVIGPAAQPRIQSGDLDRVDLSVIAPVFNEEGNLLPLHDELVAVLSTLGRSYEVVYVDDGSQDQSFAELSILAERDANVCVVQLRRNFGQTPAIAAGVDHARGAVLVFIDSDLQNDPADIPRLLALIDQGYDVVSGWRKDRQDPAISRKLPSHIANSLISHVTGVPLHDYGCTLKAYRAELLRQVPLYGEMHRFVPAYLAVLGARITEIPVSHHPRIRGKSKYGISRTGKVILDLLTVKFMGSFATKPIYVFGGGGLACLLLSFLTLVAMVWQKFAVGVSMIQTPLLLLSALLFVVGMQTIMMGLIAELLMRTYHESQRKPTYVLRKVLNRAGAIAGG